jgi:hypothetical protein
MTPAPTREPHPAWAFPSAGPRATRDQDVIDRALADAREHLAAERVERPDVELLDLPARRYYLWTGPLRSATAFRQQPQDPPSRFPRPPLPA